MDFKLVDSTVLDDDIVETDEYEGNAQPIKTVTLREILEAVKANGIPHIRGQWFDTGDFNFEAQAYEIKGGCAVAQAAKNLGIDPNYITELSPILDIINLNDDEDSKLTLEEIAAQIEQEHADELDTPMTTHVADYSKGVPGYVYDRLVGN